MAMNHIQESKTIIEIFPELMRDGKRTKNYSVINVLVCMITILVYIQKNIASSHVLFFLIIDCTGNKNCIGLLLLSHGIKCE